MQYRVNNLLYAAGNDLLNTIRSQIRMTEPINPDILRKAADMAIIRYPYFAVKLIRSNEEYIMIPNNEPLVISSEGKAITLGGDASNHHLMALAYDKDSIYIDTSHFITDGNGIFPFIKKKTLLYCYLHILHPNETFDTANINLPDRDISPDEADDYPFPDKTIPTEPLGEVRIPENVYTLQDQPNGYAARDKWTSFRIKIKQKQMMNYASSVDGSPASFIAAVMYRSITLLDTDIHQPIVCGMQHQYRKALGKPMSHLCHVNIVPIVYPEQMKNKDIELLNTMTRGSIILRADDTNDLQSVNKHITNEEKIKTLSLREKKQYMREELLNGIGKNTFEVSYTGRVPFSGLDKYITDFIPYIDMSLSGGISIEIFSVHEWFCINIMQRNDNSQYVNKFVELLESFGIKCEAMEQSHFEISNFILPN